VNHDSSAEAITHTLELALENMRKGRPQDLKEAMQFFAKTQDLALPRQPLAAVIGQLKTCGPNDPLLHSLTMALQGWDHRDGEWAGGTEAHSEERRTRVLKALGFATSEQRIINDRVMRFIEADLPIVIATAHKPWYPERQKTIKPFYWSDYTKQLRPPKGKWSADAVGVLDISIDDVISRLSDPTQREIYAAKGLVMGYVQSGKTSHFSGLIAKAADAGYRLIIVLAGTLDILRQQTQRRLDKEIVGQELLGTEEYGNDVDWKAFVSHGGLPSALGAFDWERLTNHDDDYKKLSQLLVALEFKPSIPTKPFNDPANLRNASAKLAVIKKVPARLNKLCDDLEALGQLRTKLQHVPTLIIDDESDQASINVVDQRKADNSGKRSTTNKAIGRLLKLLPRAQYVGYTATPFANVFIDPEDAEDLFPKDFIVSLPRPAGYMGVSDFFDFDQEYKKGDYRGNENAFVRSVKGDNEAEPNLPRAIDAFVLAGAIKLYRAHKQPEKYGFRHHTMLVHHSATRTVHENDRELVAGIFKGGARYHTAAGLTALADLFDSDFKKVSKVRAAEEPFPASFNALKPFISQCLTKIASGNAVRVVNGDGKNRDDTPDFDQIPVWAILVGGTKLSRGYTVEGLTVSYYRRPTGAGDTLMQMGRWFGFRQGYQDLVRLFIGREEKRGKATIDLYEAFGAVCRDEESLRADLSKYASDGLKPLQVPPLVRQHMAALPPTSANKRFNAEICAQDFAGDWTEKTAASSNEEEMKENLVAAADLLRAGKLSQQEDMTFVNDNGDRRHFQARFVEVSGEDVLKFLIRYKWASGRQPIQLELRYIREQLNAKKLSQWLIMLPQIESSEPVIAGRPVIPPLSVIQRARVTEDRFGVYSEPRHREAASAIAGGGQVGAPSAELKARTKTSKPVVVLYFVRERGNDAPDVSVGFGVRYPGVKRDTPLTWVVGDKSQADAVVVDARR
jgi:hypothetical protein